MFAHVSLNLLNKLQRLMKIRKYSQLLGISLNIVFLSEPNRFSFLFQTQF